MAPASKRKHVDGRFLCQSVCPSSPASSAESAAGGHLAVRRGLQRGEYIDVESFKAVYKVADRRYEDPLKRFMKRYVYGTLRPGSQKVTVWVFGREKKPNTKNQNICVKKKIK